MMACRETTGRNDNPGRPPILYMEVGILVQLFNNNGDTCLKAWNLFEIQSKMLHSKATMWGHQGREFHVFPQVIVRHWTGTNYLSIILTILPTKRRLVYKNVVANTISPSRKAWKGSLRNVCPRPSQLPPTLSGSVPYCISQWLVSCWRVHFLVSL